MKKKYRLKKRNDFKEVLQKGKNIKTSNLIFLYLPEKSGDKEKKIENIKIGVIIPKKKCKRAVDRNYLKRIIWASHSGIKLEKLPLNFSIFLYTNFFFSKFSRCKKVNFSELKKDIKKIYYILTKKCS